MYATPLDKLKII